MCAPVRACPQFLSTAGDNDGEAKAADDESLLLWRRVIGAKKPLLMRMATVGEFSRPLPPPHTELMLPEQHAGPASSGTLCWGTIATLQPLRRKPLSAARTSQPAPAAIPRHLFSTA